MSAVGGAGALAAAAFTSSPLRGGMASSRPVKRTATRVLYRTFTWSSTAAKASIGAAFDSSPESRARRSGSAPSAAKQVTVEHRLQPFSPEYYRADAALFSYSAANAGACAVAGADPADPEAFVPKAAGDTNGAGPLVI